MRLRTALFPLGLVLALGAFGGLFDSYWVSTLTVGVVGGVGGQVSLQGDATMNSTTGIGSTSVEHERTIVATPAPDYLFVGWFANSNGTGEPLSTEARTTHTIKVSTDNATKTGKAASGYTYTRNESVYAKFVYHSHDIVYTTDGDTIYRRCQNTDGNCPGGVERSATLSAYNKTCFDGQPHGATVSGDLDCSLEYFQDGVSIGTSAPTAVGAYTAVMSAGGQSVTKKFEIVAYKTDLPEDLVDEIDGIPFPRLSSSSTTGNLVKDAAFLLGGERKHFFSAVGEIVDVLDEEAFLGLLKQLGYTIFSSDKAALDRTFDIRGYLQPDQVPDPNELSDALVSALAGNIDSACSDLDDIKSSWAGSFELVIELAGNEYGLNGTYVDLGDVRAIAAALKVVEAALYLLQGYDLATLQEIITAVNMLSRASDGSVSAEAIFVRLPGLLKGCRNAPALAKAAACLTAAAKYLKEANAAMGKRTDGHAHLLGYGDECGHLLALPKDNPIVAVVLANLDNLATVCSETVTLDVKGSVAAIDADLQLPFWMRDSYRITLKPLFEGKVCGSALSPTVDADGFAWLETLPSPTLCGMLPDFTLKEAVRALENLALPERWSMAAYAENEVNMPYDVFGNGNGIRRSIVLDLTDLGILSFAPAMGNAPPTARLQLYVDGTLVGTAIGGQDGPEKTHAITTSGDHHVEWVFSTTDNATLPSAGVHPVAAYAYTQTEGAKCKCRMLSEQTSPEAVQKVDRLCGAKGEAAQTVSAWLEKRGVTSAALAKTKYAMASFDLGVGLLDAGAELAKVAISDATDDPANGFSFKIAVKADGAATSEVVKAAAERVSKYIFATGDLGDGFETTVDASRITIGDDGLVTIRPDPKKTAEFFRVVIPADK